MIALSKNVSPYTNFNSLDLFKKHNNLYYAASSHKWLGRGLAHVLLEPNGAAAWELGVHGEGGGRTTRRRAAREGEVAAKCNSPRAPQEIKAGA